MTNQNNPIQELIAAAMREVARKQIQELYEKVVGPAPKELVEALEKATGPELAEAANYLPAIIQSAMWTQIWDDYKAQREKQAEQQICVIKKIFN